MFQTFDASSSPDQGPPRLAALRAELDRLGVDGFLIPRADVHQGEYVAPRDERLSWLTGFTGSAGFCVALKDRAGLFVDGRYRVQARQQCDEAFTIVHWPEVQLAAWLQDNMSGGKIAFDPWLHTVGQIDQLHEQLAGSDISLTASANLVDEIWADQPEKPMARAFAQPVEYAGESSAEKRARLGQDIANKGASAAVITLPDSLCWLLNIRGEDIAHNPVVHGFVILHADGTCDLIANPEKFTELGAHLGDGVTLRTEEDLLPTLQALTGPVLLERSSVPTAIAAALTSAGVPVVFAADPCSLPKACKNKAEIDGAVAAHLRDGVAVANFLAWFDENATKGITEIDVVTQLEGQRAATNMLRDISFDTIAGAGSNGAVIHYRVTHETNRTLQDGELLVLDSGGQYQDGTTDITRTLAIGTAGEEEKRAFTLVLKGMIAVSELRFPKGLAGRDIQSIARVPLWAAGLDFDHGLGHGVGSYLSVHEGPQSLSTKGHVPLEAGMIVSNEPGYYKEGAYGIRIENLLVVEPAPNLEGGDSHRQMLQFKTLPYVPIDLALVNADMLSPSERDWLNAYHEACFRTLNPHVDASTKGWLQKATARI
ncbi:aminopeptidase P family protein [Cognatishimia sp.]|uniref:aminopeptidase P family protein n=1 Tax=Cognatishimia sp. TaxID=2211648 RepID=UPI00351295F1